MLGAIIGDIVGSVYEWHNIKTKDFPLFREDCFFTDDTVMTCAVADAILNGGEEDKFIDSMKKFGRMYPDAGYGGRFGSWLFSDSQCAFDAFGMVMSDLCGEDGSVPAVGRPHAGSCAEAAIHHPCAGRNAHSGAVAVAVIWLPAVRKEP